ncbi:MAG TPA: helix-turn-helix transcriptional regulator [Solirubrobacteraceae bacterium]|jgi:DNA-binding NarL/FixJ family response regulator|nr:helix-turn-helix transcriptional regulator [Solirubrobacteraceae bacterium]
MISRQRAKQQPIFEREQALDAIDRTLSTAGGATNRQIAQSLFVTSKTVEYHLKHAFQKLGVSSRGDLGPALATVAGQSVHR